MQYSTLLSQYCDNITMAQDSQDSDSCDHEHMASLGKGNMKRLRRGLVT